MTHRALLTLTSALLATGCSHLMPAAEMPMEQAVAIPEAFDHTPELDASRAQDAEWWEAFNDPVLNDLTMRALAANLSIETGLANLRAAQAAVRSAGSVLLPSASVSASASSDTDSGLDDISATGRLSASYEIDLFGTNRQSVDVTELSLLTTEYDQRTIELSVQSNVASTYFSLLATRNSLAVAKQNLTISERIYQIVQARYDAGDVSGFDVASQTASLANARARIPAIQDQIEGFEAALAILLGLPPQGFAVEDTDLLLLNVPGIDTGLPSDLLYRRPDLLSAETSLRAARINVEIARKAFLPSVDLGAGASSLLTNGFDLSGSLSSSLNLPLFTGGQLEGQLDSARARADSALISYNQSVLTALQDVDVSLSGLRSATDQESDLRDAEAASKRALELAELRYRAGADDLTSLLNAQQTYQSAAQSLVDNRRDQLTSVVNVYAAIGGGWMTG
jgi:NodT family efflux transporter outer membrane factor (OMF) lipoprotein